MTELSDKQLKIAQSFVKHKTFWQRLSIFTLFLLDFAFIYIVALNIVVFLAGDLKHQQVLKELATVQLNYSEIHQRHQGAPLRVTSVKSVPAGQNKVDLIAEITNPNTRLLASNVSYRFIVNGSAQENMQTFILPGERKIILGFGVQGLQPLTANGREVRFEVLGVDWQRVNVTPESQELLQNLRVEDMSWTNTSSGFRVQGTLANDSAAGYWSVGLPVVARSVSDVKGVNYVTLFQIEPGERREFEANWDIALSGITGVAVRPEINVYNDSVFMKRQGSVIDPSGIE